jgi:hypothetical protein
MAFVSLRVQVDGLIGARGILPAAEWLRTFEAHAHGTPLETTFAHGLPTLLWLSPSDTMLHVVCGAGVLCGVLLVLGVAPILTTAACWLLHLSLVNVGEIFLQYQWDSLLLEVALFATFFAPSGLLPWRGTPRPPTFAATWALRLLLLRFMFASGAVKYLSGDPTWADGSALTLHYFTQPLPTILGWFAHQMPAWWHRASCVGMFAVELGAPWLLFCGRIGRRVFAVATVGLMAGIAATGNYGWFEPLTVVLCLPLLVENSEPVRWLDLTSRRRAVVTGARLAASLAVAWFAALAFVLFLYQLSGSPVGPRALRATQEEVRLAISRSDLFWWVYEPLAPWRSLNTYGLFAVMTTERPSLEIQGSDDLANWQSYDFRWREGDLSQPPRFCEPHMPRLDWQMWFAALRRTPEPWFERFLFRLLEGEPSVLALLDHDPFPDRPPRYVRAIRFDYEFTTPAERAATGHWWKRRETGVYQPPISLR